MNTLDRLRAVNKITETIISEVINVSSEFAGQVEIETFENTMYVICEDSFVSDLKRLFEKDGLDFIVRDNGNNNHKFMISLGA